MKRNVCNLCMGVYSTPKIVHGNIILICILTIVIVVRGAGFQKYFFGWYILRGNTWKSNHFYAFCLIAVDDVDGDGFLELFHVNSSSNNVFINSFGPRFSTYKWNVFDRNVNFRQFRHGTHKHDQFNNNIPQLVLQHPIALKWFEYIQNCPIFPINECNTFSPQHLWYAVLKYLQINKIVGLKTCLSMSWIAYESYSISLTRKMQWRFGHYI